MIKHSIFFGVILSLVSAYSKSKLQISVFAIDGLGHYLPPKPPPPELLCPLTGNETTCNNCVYITSQSDFENNGNFTTCGGTFGGVIILNDAIGNLTFPPELTSIWTIKLFDNTNVLSLSLPNVSSLQRLLVENATSLQSVDLPKLTVSYQLIFQNVPAIETLNTPVLPSVGELRLSGVQSNISQFNVNIGFGGGYFIIDSCIPPIFSNILNSTEFGLSNVTGFYFPRLNNIANDFTIYNSPKLTTIGLDTLQNINGSFIISDNPSLTTLQFASLARIGAITITNNTSLVSLGTFAALESTTNIGLLGPFQSLSALNSSFSSLKTLDDNTVITIDFTSNATTVECRWADIPGPKLTSWESDFTCNKTRKTSLASSSSVFGSKIALIVTIWWILLFSIQNESILNLSLVS
jgi:hypothetical protein